MRDGDQPGAVGDGLDDAVIGRHADRGAGDLPRLAWPKCSVALVTISSEGRDRDPSTMLQASVVDVVSARFSWATPSSPPACSRTPARSSTIRSKNGRPCPSSSCRRNTAYSIEHQAQAATSSRSGKIRRSAQEPAQAARAHLITDLPGAWSKSRRPASASARRARPPAIRTRAPRTRTWSMLGLAFEKHHSGPFQIAKRAGSLGVDVDRRQMQTCWVARPSRRLQGLERKNPKRHSSGRPVACRLAITNLRPSAACRCDWQILQFAAREPGHVELEHRSRRWKRRLFKCRA